MAYPYTNYFNGSFSQPSYGYTPQAYQNNNGIMWVQGEAAAKAWNVPPGNSALLMDSEASVFYIKTADASGLPTIRVFEYKERTQSSSQPEKVDMSNYVSRDEFNALAAKIEALTGKEDSDA